MQFTSIPGQGKITSKGVTIQLAAGDDISMDDYRAYVDIPCRVTIEPLPQPVDGESFELDSELVE
jgi:hypothetical protein